MCRLFLVVFALFALPSGLSLAQETDTIITEEPAYTLKYNEARELAKQKNYTEAYNVFAQALSKQT